jgi:hypothetical protein
MYRIAADIVWLAHFAVVVIALFGWLAPSLWFVYVAVLIGTLISTLSLGYCIFSKWEFDLRKKVNPSTAYDFTYASFYTYRLTRGYLSNAFLKWAGVGFTGISLLIWLYFKFGY